MDLSGKMSTTESRTRCAGLIALCNPLARSRERWEFSKKFVPRASQDNTISFVASVSQLTVNEIRSRILQNEVVSTQRNFHSPF